MTNVKRPTKETRPRRTAQGEASRPRRTQRAVRRITVAVDGVEISGPADAVEDFLLGLEVDRRAADPANQRLIPLADIRAKHGL